MLGYQGGMIPVSAEEREPLVLSPDGADTDVIVSAELDSDAYYHLTVTVSPSKPGNFAGIEVSVQGAGYRSTGLTDAMGEAIFNMVPSDQLSTLQVVLRFPG